MTADPIAYKRANTVSLLGLAIQFVLAATMLLLGVFGEDHAATTSFLYLLLGLPIWLALALVFHQHRLERLEAAEAELYSQSSAAQASVFEEVDVELRVAARRLQWMHRILLPAVSLLVGAGLVALGLWRFSSARSTLEDIATLEPKLGGWAVALGLAIAAIGFILARFVAGMAKVRHWALLRAGASWMIGASLLGLIFAVAHGVEYAGSQVVLRYVILGFPIVMVALGAEVFLNFLLNVYRPRTAGQISRPAFDSSILGFFAAPDKFVESISDAINYQFGFDVSSTWFYQLLSRRLTALLVLGLLVLWSLTLFTVVKPNERGLHLRSGRLLGEVDPGLVLKWPWPLDSVSKYPALAVNNLTAGAEHPPGEDPILWTTPHAGREPLMLVQPTPAASRLEGSDTRDFALLAIELALQYTIDDLRDYILFAADSSSSDDPNAIRRNVLVSVASRELTRFAATMSVDDILGERRSQMSRALRDRIQEAFDQLGPIDPETGEPRGAGVKLLFVGVAGAHPPSREGVAQQFQGVVAASQSAEAQIETARAESIERLAAVAGDATLARRIIDEFDKLERMQDEGAGEREIAEQELAIEAALAGAGGEAAQMILEARADRWRRHMSARVAAARNNGRTALYNAAPDVYRAILYLDALADAAGQARLFITALKPDIRLDFDEIQTNIGGFEVETPE